VSPEECDEAELVVLRLMYEALSAEIEEAKHALGLAWLAGGVTLAEGIRRKTAALEAIQ
jgi:hypothetical protein